MQISLLIQTRPLFRWIKNYYGLWTILVTHVLMMDLFLTIMQLLASLDIN